MVLDANNVPIIVQQGLNTDEEIIVEKIGFAEGMAKKSNFANKSGEYPNNYSCKAKLPTGEEVSFWLNEAQHQQWALMGGVDDKVKVKCVSKEDGFGGFKQVLEFSKVE